MVAVVTSPPIHLHTLIDGFQFGSGTADVAFALQVLTAGLYLWGWRRLARRGRRWPAARAAAFLGGVLVLFIALVSGLASYDDSNFSAHVVQHMLLMMVAPPLLALGAPVTMALQASRRPVQSRLARILHTRGLVLLTAPLVIAPLYYASMWVDMQSSFYRYSLTHPFAHDASHVVMFSLGCLFWWPLVGLDELPRRPHPGVRLAMVALGMPFESFLAIALMNVSEPMAPNHTLADTHNGGSIFWIGAMSVTAVAILVAGAWWMRSEDREAVRADRRAQFSAAGADLYEPDDPWAAAWRARTGSVPVMRAAAERNRVP